MSNDKVDESIDFDDLVDKVDENNLPSSLASMFGITEEEVEEEYKPWKKHWKGMPEYEQEALSSYKKLIVRFRNEEDYQEFARFMEQKLTKKTKSAWYPELDKRANSLLRWIDDNSDDDK